MGTLQKVALLGAIFLTVLIGAMVAGDGKEIVAEKQ